MRIVVDMQGAQSESRFRGIGRYTMSFTQALVRNRRDHEIILALNGLFPDTIEPIRAAFESLLPQENIRVWYAPGPVNESIPGNEGRRRTAEMLREAFLESLQPDLIHISSIFEGYTDNAVTSIGEYDKKTHVSITHYDLIPLQNPEHFLKADPAYAAHYRQKLEFLKKANLFLAISNSSGRDAIKELKLNPISVVPVMAAVDEKFQKGSNRFQERSGSLAQYGIKKPFLFYTGGADEHKNLKRLIHAFSLFRKKTNIPYQLVFGGRIHIVDHLLDFARSLHLGPGELVFTGYIPDDDLIGLYKDCELVVFPSWQEGFGFPVLESMACGTPVICSNQSSLPEVIGCDEATFDPFDPEQISNKILEVVSNPDFKKKLIEHGLRQATAFSWEATAKKAIAAWEGLVQGGGTPHPSRRREKPSIESYLAQQGLISSNELAHLSSCLDLNKRIGLERQLLVDISELCQRDAATGVQRVVRNHLKNLLEHPPKGFRVEPVYATQEGGYHYANRFTSAFLHLNNRNQVDDYDAPINWQRGDIFFALDMQHHVQLAQRDFYKQLRRDGVVVKFMIYDLLPIQLEGLFCDPRSRELHARWLEMISATDGAVCISQATVDEYWRWISDQGLKCPLRFSLDAVHLGADLKNANPSLGLPRDALRVLEKLRRRPTFLCVSTIEPRKMQAQILEAFEELWKEGRELNLVFVGKLGWKVEELARRMSSHSEAGNRFFWLEGISDEFLDEIYSAATCTIAASLNEGFGLSLVESAIKGVPLIVRDIPVFREVAGDNAFYFSGVEANDLAAAVRVWLGLKEKNSAPDSRSLLCINWRESTELVKTVLVQNTPQKQLFLDISTLIEEDAHTGIQRVVKNIIKLWLQNPPAGYDVKLVYATNDFTYKYANNFTSGLESEFQGENIDSFIEPSPGDLFFGLDLHHHVPRVHFDYFKKLRKIGVKVLFMVYDMLPIQFPDFWEKKHKVSQIHDEWLSVITSFDGAVCISSAVAKELRDWISKKYPNQRENFKIEWFHLGADIAKHSMAGEISEWDQELLRTLEKRPTFLMVGTLEPRKGHAQVWEAFEHLWKSGADVNLVIVGKQGWLVDDLCKKLRSHAELNQRLFWLEGITDEYLEKVYAASSCLIAASYGEGFGLPLIEAAQHGLPILARDIPVFREVAGDYAAYFNAETPNELAVAIKSWLADYQKSTHPKSSGMNYLTWKQSAAMLLNKICQGETAKDSEKNEPLACAS
jgi:glycosyltransferase involved in cell wall biosynthesis